MKTNFEMVKELDKAFQPKRRGVIEMSEIYFINKSLCLDEMDILQLRNLRDLTVMFYNLKMETEGGFDYDTHDKMSAIVAVIDQKIRNNGGEI